MLATLRSALSALLLVTFCCGKRLNELAQTAVHAEAVFSAAEKFAQNLTDNKDFKQELESRWKVAGALERDGIPISRRFAWFVLARKLQEEAVQANETNSDSRMDEGTEMEFGKEEEATTEAKPAASLMQDTDDLMSDEDSMADRDADRANLICYTEDAARQANEWSGSVDDGDLRAPCMRISNLPKRTIWNSHKRYLPYPICSDTDEHQIRFRKGRAGPNYHGYTRSSKDQRFFSDMPDGYARHSAVQVRGCCESRNGTWHPKLFGPNRIRLQQCTSSVEIHIGEDEDHGLMFLGLSPAERKRVQMPVRLSSVSSNSKAWSTGIRAGDYVLAIREHGLFDSDIGRSKNRWRNVQVLTEAAFVRAAAQRPVSFRIDHVPRANEEQTSNGIGGLGFTYKIGRLNTILASHGFTLAYPIKVKSVTPGTLWWDRGMHYNDKIIKVNKIPTSSLTLAALERLFEKKCNIRIDRYKTAAHWEKEFEGSEEFIVHTYDELEELGISLDVTGAWGKDSARLPSQPVYVLSVQGKGNSTKRQIDIHVGDEIISMNRRPVSRMRLRSFQRMWKEERPLAIRYRHADRSDSSSGHLRIRASEALAADDIYQRILRVSEAPPSPGTTVFNYDNKGFESNPMGDLQELMTAALEMARKLQEVMDELLKEESAQGLRVTGDAATTDKNHVAQWSAFSKELSDQENSCVQQTESAVRKANLETELYKTPEELAHVEQLSDEKREIVINDAAKKAQEVLQRLEGDGPTTAALLEQHIYQFRRHERVALSSGDVKDVVRVIEHLKHVDNAACGMKRHNDSQSIQKLLEAARSRTYVPSIGVRGVGYWAAIFNWGQEEVIDYDNLEIAYFDWAGYNLLGTSFVGASFGGYYGFGWRGKHFHRIDLEQWYSGACVWLFGGYSLSALPSLPAISFGLGGTLAILSQGKGRIWKPDWGLGGTLTFGWALGFSAFDGNAGFDLGQSYYTMTTSECFDSVDELVKAIWVPWCHTCGKGMNYVHASKMHLHTMGWPLIAETISTINAYARNSNSSNENSKRLCSKGSTRYRDNSQRLAIAIDQRLIELCRRLELLENFVDYLIRAYTLKLVDFNAFQTLEKFVWEQTCLREPVVMGDKRRAAGCITNSDCPGSGSMMCFNRRCVCGEGFCHNPSGADGSDVCEASDKYNSEEASATRPLKALEHFRYWINGMKLVTGKLGLRLENLKLNKITTTTTSTLHSSTTTTTTTIYTDFRARQLAPWQRTAIDGVAGVAKNLGKGYWWVRR